MLYWNEVIPKNYFKEIQSRKPLQSKKNKNEGTEYKWKLYVEDVVEKSTIHGFRHLAIRNRHPIERLLFLGALIGAVVCMTLIGMSTWERYNERATILILEHDYRDFFVTFPSVTLCIVQPLNESAFAQVFRKYDIPDTKEARHFFTYLSSATYRNFKDAPIFDGINSALFAEILFELKVDFIYEEIRYNTVPEVSFRPAPVPTLTENGICFAVDTGAGLYSAPKYWKEKSWDLLNNTIFGTAWDYDQRFIELQIMGFTDVIKTFVLHHPEEVPDLKQLWNTAESITDTTAYYTIEQTDVSSGIHDLTIRQRKCKFAWDGGLERWPYYSRTMCRRDCRVRKSLEKCGCIPYFSRPLGGEKICDSKGMHCLSRNVGFILNITNKICDCSPNCEDVSYSVVDVQTSLKPFGRTCLRLQLAYFPMTKYRRAVLFGYIDFLVAVGGTAGLFVGASFLSFVELFYFATLRLARYVAHRRRTAEKKSFTKKQ